MKVVDANVLLYAVNADTEHHEASRAWLDAALSGEDVVGFTWPALTAFLRLATKPGLFPSPLSPEDALDQLDLWLSAPGATLIGPGDQHAVILRRLVRSVGTGGNLVSDAHLAAIAVEHRASVVTFDSDFDRFDQVRWGRPGAAQSS